MIRLLLLGFMMLIMLNIASEIHQIKLMLTGTRTEAHTAMELVKYWLPPISDTRMNRQCARCHR